MLSPHHRHSTSLLSASEEAQELEETRRDRKREREHQSLERLYLDDEASTNLESRGQWSAEPTAPCRLLFSESRTGSENREEMTFLQPSIINFHLDYSVSSPAEAVFQRRWGHLSSEPGHVAVGLLEGGEALDGSRRCNGSLPAVSSENPFSPASQPVY